MILGAAAAAAALLAYLPALAAGFTSDDFLIVALLQETGGLDDATVYFTRSFYDYYRPLAFLSHGADWELWGAQPIGFHLTNVLLHAANTGLVFAIGRRLLSPLWACAAALLFGLHPSSHEAVYWIAARFDLLATLLGLVAVLALTSPGRGARAIGLSAFALALLSKESAAAVPLLVSAHDVLIASRPRAEVVRRVIPLLVVMAGYAILRTLAADVSPIGGRMGKLAMFAGALAALVLMARSDAARAAPAAWRPSSIIAGLGVVAVAAAAFLPATAPWIREKLTFVAYTAFHLATPVVQPPPPAFFVDPSTPVYWTIGLGVVAAIAWMGSDRGQTRVRPGSDQGQTGVRPGLRLSEFPPLQFFIVWIVAALLPVSTMTGGARYLYLATVGSSLGAAALAQWLPTPWRTLVRVGIVGCLAIAPTQLVLAGRAWIWASEMSAAAAAAVAPRLTPCGTVDLVLLTAPVQIRGVYSNLNAETFSTGGCAPASVRALTRIVRDDVAVEITSAAARAIEWRIPIDRGNVVASSDLRTFDRPLRAADPAVIVTPLGRLESRMDGAARLFRFEPSGTGPRPVFAYYGDGRVRVVPGTVQ